MGKDFMLVLFNIVMLFIICLGFTAAVFSDNIKERQKSGLYLAVVILLSILLVKGVLTV